MLTSATTSSTTAKDQDETQSQLANQWPSAISHPTSDMRHIKHQTSQWNYWNKIYFFCLFVVVSDFGDYITQGRQRAEPNQNGMGHYAKGIQCLAISMWALSYDSPLSVSPPHLLLLSICPNVEQLMSVCIYIQSAWYIYSDRKPYLEIDVYRYYETGENYRRVRYERTYFQSLVWGRF